jgi:hypothetical protein
MQSPSREPYFILPAKKEPLLSCQMVGFQRAPLMTGVLVLVLIVIMVLVALSLGALWDGLTTVSQLPSRDAGIACLIS